MSKSTEESLLAQIDALKDQMEKLTRIVQSNQAPGPMYPMWMLIRDYLLSVGGKASPKNIAEDLVKQGHNLGRYPLRNVKITLTSPLIRNMFTLKKDATGEETAILVDHPVTFVPRGMVGRKKHPRNKQKPKR